MYLAHVAPDNTMPVPGYEHHSLKCSECGDTERRLVFAGDEVSPDAKNPLQNPPPKATPAREPSAKAMPAKAALVEEAPAKQPSAQEGAAAKATPPSTETPATMGETPVQGRALEPGGQDARHASGPEGAPAAPSNPPAKWAAAVEKGRTRDTAVIPPAPTQPPAAEKAAERPAAASADELSDFDRMWDNLPPRPQAPRPQVPPPQAPPPQAPPPQAPPPQAPQQAAARANPPDPRPGVDALAARVRTALQRQPPRKPGGMLGGAPQAPLAPAKPKGPAEPKDPAEPMGPSEPKPARSVLSQARSRWTHAIATLRTWPGKAARIQKNDAILQIDADALEVRPRRPD